PRSSPTRRFRRRAVRAPRFTATAGRPSCPRSRGYLFSHARDTVRGMHERGDVVRGLVSSADFGRIVLAVVASVELSFLDGASTTRSEIRRRTDMAWDLVKTLRGDLKWSVAKILDHLTAYLRCELDG